MDGIEELQNALEDQKKVMEELIEMLFRQQARIQAMCEVMIKADITDPQELMILENDNLDTLQYAVIK